MKKSIIFLGFIFASTTTSFADCRTYPTNFFLSQNSNTRMKIETDMDCRFNFSAGSRSSYSSAKILIKAKHGLATQGDDYTFRYAKKEDLLEMIHSLFKFVGRTLVVKVAQP